MIIDIGRLAVIVIVILRPGPTMDHEASILHSIYSTVYSRHMDKLFNLYCWVPMSQIIQSTPIKTKPFFGGPLIGQLTIAAKQTEERAETPGQSPDIGCIYEDQHCSDVS